MKIGILCHSTYGGSGVVAAELGKHLARKGHQIHFITVGRPFRLASYQPNIFVHEVSAFHHPLFEVPPYFLTQVSRTVEVIKRYDLDILHAHYALPHSLGAHLARQISGRQIPIITTLHGTDTSLVGAHEEFFEITRHGLMSSDLVTAVSNFLAKQTKTTFDYNRDIPVIYNFIDTEIFSPDTNNYSNIFRTEKKTILMHISNFRPLKRVLDVIDIFSFVRKNREVTLIMVGDGPDMPLAQKRALELNVFQDIIFLGRQDNVSAILAAADVMLLPSCCESFGLAALEALACGVPVVASNAGGIPEVVVHGQVGFLAPVGEIEEMARYTMLLLDNPGLWQQISNRAREHAVTRFNSSHWVAQYEHIYQQLLE